MLPIGVIFRGTVILTSIFIICLVMIVPPSRPLPSSMHYEFERYENCLDLKNEYPDVVCDQSEFFLNLSPTEYFTLPFDEFGFKKVFSVYEHCLKIREKDPLMVCIQPHIRDIQ
jgi:hypothetical protein